MPTTEQDISIKNYREIMTEINVRIDVIQKLAKNRAKYPALIVKETCYLQFRIICELISSSCLIAHGDIKAGNVGKLQKEYAADLIANNLHKIHSEFFPTPFKQITTAPNQFTCIPIDNSYLKKDDLVRLVHKCGSIVHRGSLKKLLKSNNPIQNFFPEMERDLQLIVNLLDVHYIKLIQGNYILCIMNSSGNKSVQVAFAEEIPTSKK